MRYLTVYLEIELFLIFKLCTDVKNNSFTIERFMCIKWSCH